MIKKVVILDLDGTLIQGESQKIIFLYFWHIRLISNWTFIRVIFWFLLYKMKIISNVSWIMKKAYLSLKGIEVKDFNKILKIIIKKKIKPRIYPQFLKKIQDFQKKGYKIGIISTSINMLVQILAKELKLDFGIGTILEQKNKILTGKIKGNILYHYQKVIVLQKLALKRKWNLNQSYAFSDNFSDLPLLKIVGHPIVINPDRKLKKIAKQLHWSIYQWKIN